MNTDTFNKNSFKKSQNRIIISCVLIFLVGLLSIACSIIFIIPDLLDWVYGTTDYDFYELESLDSKEYLGTYYGFDSHDQKLYTVNLTHDKTAEHQDKCTITISNGMIGNETVITEDFKVLSPRRAQLIHSNFIYSDHHAIITYNESTQESRFFWIDAEGGLCYEDVTYLSKEQVSLAEEMNDPEDYYGTYRYSDTNYVTFNQDGTAKLIHNGNEKNFSYLYVSADWCKANTQKLRNYRCIILYTPGETSFEYFYYINNETLYYAGNSSNKFTLVKEYTVSDEKWKSYFNFTNFTVRGYLNDMSCTAYVSSSTMATLVLDICTLKLKNDEVYMDGTLMGYDAEEYKFWTLFDFSDDKDMFVSYDNGKTFVSKKEKSTITIEIKNNKISTITLTTTEGNTTRSVDYTFSNWGSTRTY